MKKKTIPAKEIISRLQEAKRVLIFTHRRPDGDALGSSFGLREFLRTVGKIAEVAVVDEPPRRYRKLCTNPLKNITVAEADSFDLIVGLDCASIARIGLPEPLNIEYLRSVNFINIDHHELNNLSAPVNYIHSEASSTCQMVAELIFSQWHCLTAETATFLLAGMMTDTGCFCFSNTSGKALRTAAKLRDNGADVELIANELFFNKAPNQLAFEADLSANCLKFSCNNRFAYAYVEPALLEKHNYDLSEDEGLIDILRGLEGVVIAMLCHKSKEGFRISLRSKDRNYPVRQIAMEFGGGGHEMAAGATLDLPEFADVEKLISMRIGKLLEK